MGKLITGIHHITAIAAGTQQNYEFYSGILGLRMVKKTVNFDAPEVYHLYYGNEAGEPGTILTFFPYEKLVSGRQGKGMLNTTSFSVPGNSLNYWLLRLKKFGIEHKQPIERFGSEIVVYFEDPDGLGLELVFNDNDKRAAWKNGPVDAKSGIRGFFGAEIWEEGYERTAGLLTEQLDHELIGEQGNRFRFAAVNSPGNYMDVVCRPDSLKGLSGSGTVHHIAFATPNLQSQEEVRLKIVKRMLNPTPILDRNYFTSIYFREPGGVLFEIATWSPGFQVDEELSQLGGALKLPAQYESNRGLLEGKLPVINTDLSNYK